MSIFLISVPPKQPKIIDETGREVVSGSFVGPYMKGDTVVLKCITLGGNLNSDDYSIYQYICREKQNLRD